MTKLFFSINPITDNLLPIVMDQPLKSPQSLSRDRVIMKQVYRDTLSRLSQKRCDCRPRIFAILSITVTNGKTNMYRILQ